MRSKLIVATCTICLTSSWALADEEEHERRSNRNDSLSYSYFEASIIEYDMDIGGIDIEPDGYKIKLSVSLGDSLYAIVDRNKTDGSFSGADYEFDTQGYGFGLHGDSWYASYTNNTWDFDGNEFDVDTIRLGFRNKWSERLEFNASYSWNNIEDADNDDGFQVGIAYEITNNFHLIADYETIGGDLDVDYLSAGIRLSF